MGSNFHNRHSFTPRGQAITFKHVCTLGVHEYVGISIFNFQGFVVYHEKHENKTPSEITNHTV